MLYHLRTKQRKSHAEQVNLQLVVPTSLRDELLKNRHEQNGHAAVDRLFLSISERYYWPTLWRDVYNWVSSCEDCQTAKAGKRRPAPLVPIPLEPVLHTWHADCISYNVPSNGFHHCLVFVEALTMWVEIIPCATLDTAEMTRLLFDRIISRFGCIKRLIVDNHKSFSSKIIQSLCTLSGVKLTKVSPYHSQGNGLVERINQMLSTTLRSLIKVGENHASWSTYVTSVELAYRTTICTSSMHTPFEGLYGVKPLLNFDLRLLNEVNTSADVDVYLRQLVPKLELVRDAIKLNKEDHKALAKQQFDKFAEYPAYKPGDLVLMHHPKVPKGQCYKLYRAYSGPYVIMERFPNHTYKLKESSTGKLLKSRIHANRLKPYVKRIKPSLAQHATDADAPPVPSTLPSTDNIVHSQNSRPTVVGPTAQSLADEQQPPISKHRSANATAGPSADNSTTADPPADQHDNDMMTTDLPDGWHAIKYLSKKKFMNGEPYYFVHWADGSDPSWQPASNISDVAIEAFNSRCSRQNRRM